MPGGFIIDYEDMSLEEYIGEEIDVVIPDEVKEIGSSVFYNNLKLRSVVIPEGVTKIGIHAFQGCVNLYSVSVPDSVTVIDSNAFSGCKSLKQITVPAGATVYSGAFSGCSSLADSGGYIVVRDELFDWCGSGSSVTVPEGVRTLKGRVFSSCKELVSVTLPESLVRIENSAFNGCGNLTSVRIPDGTEEIGHHAFCSCRKLVSVRIPASVSHMDDAAFYDCPVLTVICSEGSYAHRYCVQNDFTYIFDYQFEAFGGLLPQGFEKLASPFLADEEKPFVFISYSHRDRDRVLPVLKTLYESGWRIWYDEGLTIGDHYDETLEAHVRDCSAFLLFVSENSLRSFYCRENEIPWAVEYQRPIIRCILDEGAEWDIPESIAAVSPSEIEPALEQIGGLTKGKKRTARGISVIVDPMERTDESGAGWAYCLYSGSGAMAAKTILLEARSSGCALYDAVENGADEEKLQSSVCLIVCLDRAFLSDPRLVRVLTEAYESGKDIAVCQLEEIRDEDLPRELAGLHLMQWLDFAHGISADMSTKLARHLQKRGSRNAAILPGFQYEKTERGIVIRRNTSLDPAPRIEREYGGVPVIEIGERAFRNCIHLTSLTVPEGVTRIGNSAFEGCSSLSEIILPDSLREIGDNAFRSCTGLASILLPGGVERIGEGAFYGCTALASVIIPDSVTQIGKDAFSGCKSLASVTLSGGISGIPEAMFSHCIALTSVTVPDNVKQIGQYAFSYCTGLTSVTLPDSITGFGDMAFGYCDGLADSDGLVIIRGILFSYSGDASSVVIPDGVTRIGVFAFSGHKNLISVTVPDSVTEVGYGAFSGCSERLVVTCSHDSCVRTHCSYQRIPTREPDRPVTAFLKRIGGLFRGKK